MRIPTSAEEPVESATRENILGLIRGRIDPVRVPTLYWIGLAMTAAAMALLPLLYLGVIAATLWGVQWWAVNAPGLLSFRPIQIMLIVYLAPLAGGIVMVFFMVKPLFAPRPRRSSGIQLERAAEPLLFRYVTRLCKAVGSPAPSEIRVDCQVNASASLQPGWASLWRNDLTLTLGLPLVAGCTLRQCSGVLAHEFGHFSQGTGMRLTYWIRAINAWFQRVVYERDLWDARLEALANQRVTLAVAIGHVSLLFVWITRQILRGLMMLGHLISCFMLRQMEFDADKHEARLAGSETFETTTRRIAELTVGLQMTYSDLNLFWEEGRLADDLPRLTALNVERIAPPLRKILDDAATQKRGGWFDTHPTDAQRVEAALKERSHGVLADDSRLSEAPAASLFSDFQTLCRLVTIDHYQQALGQPVPEESLSGVEELLGKKAIEADFAAARQRFFSKSWGVGRPLGSFDIEAPFEWDPEAAVTELRGIRLQLAAQFPAYQRAVEDNEKQASSDRDAQSESHDLSGVDPRTGFEDLLAKRLNLALRLFVAQQHPGEEREEEVRPLWRAARMINRILPETAEIQKTSQKLNEAVLAVVQKPRDEGLGQRLRTCMGFVHSDLTTLRGRFDDSRFPLEHQEKNLLLRDYLVPPVLDRDDLGSLLEISRQFLDRTARLHGRVMGRLALLAERGEREAGLEMLELE